jgi:PAS domain S-box-containing protein
VARNPQLAAWLVAHRARIDRALEARLGAGAPPAGAQETEVLRRFRSFAASALQRGEAAQPALDGLRGDELRIQALLSAWIDAAAETACETGDSVRLALEPLLARFQGGLRATGTARSKRGAPRTRRAVVAAIDRVADAFLAIDAEDARVIDANPAAGALLGVARDALLGADAMTFVPGPLQKEWWTELDAMTEAAEPRRFRGELVDAKGTPIPVECSVTRYATRNRTLALVVARPVS